MLESFQLGARLRRGRTYARKGQVLGLEVRPGEVTATVQGSRARPYRVLIAVETLSEADWVRVGEAMAAKAVFLARLLAGEMPVEIEEAFAACSLSLFPASPHDLDIACSCPDWANPCKHVAATYNLLAEAFDRDPFLNPHLARPDEGRAPRAVARPVGSRRNQPRRRGGRRLAEAGRGAGAARGLPRALPAGRPGACLSAVRPRAAAVPDAPVRPLDPTALAVRGRSLADLLRPAYEAMTEAAAGRALAGNG